MKVSEAQLPLVAHARADDPESSWVAARSVKNLNQTHERVKACLVIGPAVDDEIIKRYRDYYGSDATEQSIRSRRKELVNAGFVRFAGRFGTSAHGGKSRMWELVR